MLRSVDARQLDSIAMIYEMCRLVRDPSQYQSASSSLSFTRIIRTGKINTIRSVDLPVISQSNSLTKVGLAGVNVIGTPKVTLVGGSASALKSPLDGSDVLSDYDDLSFLMYTDREVAQIISKLEKKKLEAVNTERFEYAKKIKTAIGENLKEEIYLGNKDNIFQGELQEAGLILGSLEMEKQILADSQVGLTDGVELWITILHFLIRTMTRQRRRRFRWMSSGWRFTRRWR